MIRRERKYGGVSKKRQQIFVAVMLVLLPLAVLFQGLWVFRNKNMFSPFLLQFQVERADCDHCEGVGTVRDPADRAQVVLCPICFGTGSHVYRRIGKDEALCPACVGMGRVIDKETGEARWCERCDGRGLIQAGIPETR